MTSRRNIHEETESENAGKPPIWQGIFEDRCVYQVVGDGGNKAESPYLISRRPVLGSGLADERRDLGG